jgi:hypothetical protein
MKSLLYFLFLLLLSGCISTSRQQRGVIRQFAGKTENFASIPEQIMVQLAGVREDRGLYYANSFNDPSTHLSELKDIAKERFKDDKIPGRVKVAFQILDDYAKGLVQLSSETPGKEAGKLYGQLGKQLENLTSQYNLLVPHQPIPTGLVQAVSQLLDGATQQYLAGRQCRELKHIVSKADTLVSLVCDEMVRFLSSEGLEKLIKSEESGIDESFRFYFTKRSPPSIESEQTYLELLKRMEGIKILQKQAIRTAQNLKSAHKKLGVSLKYKPNPKELASDLMSYYHEADLLWSYMQVVMEKYQVK